MDEFLCFIFLSIIDTYKATICDLKKITKTRPRFKNKRLL